MKRKITCLFTMFMIAGSTLAARSASARTTVSIFNIRDRSLIADFEDATDDNCIITQTNIIFGESVTRQGGPPIIGVPTTLVTLVYANSCTGDFLSLMGGTTQQTFHIAQNLSSATLSASVPVSDDAGNSAIVNINVRWVADGPVQVVKQRIVNRNTDTIVVDRINNQVQTADVSGTISAVLAAAGPDPLDLSRFPEDGQIGKNIDSTRTITFTHP